MWANRAHSDLVFLVWPQCPQLLQCTTWVYKCTVYRWWNVRGKPENSLKYIEGVWNSWQQIAEGQIQEKWVLAQNNGRFEMTKFEFAGSNRIFCTNVWKCAVYNVHPDNLTCLNDGGTIASLVFLYTRNKIKSFKKYICHGYYYGTLDCH